MIVAIAAAWVLGCFIAVSLPDSLGGAPTAFAITSLLVAIGLASVGSHLRARAWVLLLGLLTFGCALTMAPAPAPPPMPEGLCRLEGRVLRSRHDAERGRFELELLRGRRVEDDALLPAGVRLSIGGGAPPRGSRVELLARVTMLRERRNISPHPAWPRARPLAGFGRLPPGAAIEILEPSRGHALLESLRARVRGALERTLPRRSAGLARALVLGEGGAIDERDRDAVRGSGLAHLLAVSGLHVTIVAGLGVLFLSFSLARFPMIVDPRRAAWIFGIPLSLGFAAFAGGSPSAWRAALTASLGWGLLAAGRRPRAVSVVAAAILLYALTSPVDVPSPGFLLSVLATAAIVTGPPEKRGSPLDLLRAAARVSVRATVATAPVIVWCFADLPAIGLIANVFLLPLGAALLVPSAVAHALIATTLPALARPSAALVDLLGAALLRACHALSAFPLGRELPALSLAEGVLLSFACLGVLAMRSGKGRLALIALSLVIFAGMEIDLRGREQPRDGLRLSILDVGQGDASLIDMPDGRLMLIDGGGGPATEVLLPLLSARRRRRVDVVVLTHPHPDHYGGLLDLIGRVEIGEVWDSGQAEVETPEAPSAEWVRRLEGAGVPVLGPSELCGVGKRYGPARVDVLWPCPRFDAGWGPNDNSLVLRLRYGRHRLLFTGDAEAHAEAGMLADGRALRADVLKVGHHGSRTSSNAAFLQSVDPRLALISCGIQNRYGHPHGEALGRLGGTEAELLRTDLEGGITLWSDGRELEVETWSGRRWSLPEIASRPASGSDSDDLARPSGPEYKAEQSYSSVRFKSTRGEPR